MIPLPSKTRDTLLFSSSSLSHNIKARTTLPLAPLTVVSLRNTAQLPFSSGVPLTNVHSQPPLPWVINKIKDPFNHIAIKSSNVRNTQIQENLTPRQSIVAAQAEIISPQKSDVDLTPHRKSNFLLTKANILNHGAQGKIYALQNHDDQVYIGKIFFEKETLQIEYDIYQRLGIHQCIPKCYGIHHIGKETFLVLDLIEGCSLRKFTSNLDHFCKALPKDTQGVAALRLILTQQLFLGLLFLQEKGISHADLKPSNVLIEEKTMTLKLIDFGLAKNSQETFPLLPQGTIDYIAPEEIATQGTYTTVDGYAAANIILDLLTGFRLTQSGNLFRHHTEEYIDHDSYWHQLLISGKNLVENKSPPDMFINISGQFFRPDKLRDNASIEERIHHELFENVVIPLQKFNPDERADLKTIYQSIESMTEKYLTKEMKAQARQLFDHVCAYRPPAISYE